MKHSYLSQEMQSGGIYAIFRDNQVYVGATQQSFRTRLGNHLRKLNTNIHPNPRLQNIFNKYGDMFEFRILEIVDGDTTAAEQKWINQYISTIGRTNVLNSLTIVGFNPNRYSNISKSLKGKKQCQAVIEKKRQTMMGKNSKLTDDQIITAKKMLISGETQRNVAMAFGVTQGAIRHSVIGARGKSLYPELNSLMQSGKNLGERVGSSILNEKQVQTIALLLQSGLRPNQICKEFGVHSNAIYKINIGKTWAHITSGLTYPINGKRKLTKDETEKAIQLLNAGESYSNIARQLHVTPQAIFNLRRKNEYKNYENVDRRPIKRS